MVDSLTVKRRSYENTVLTSWTKYWDESERQRKHVYTKLRGTDSHEKNSRGERKEATLHYKRPKT